MIEAMKQALEALETEVSIDWTNNDEFNASAEKMHDAIIALRQAIAELEKHEVSQEPVGWKTVPIEPTQEMIDAVPTKPHPTRPNGWGDRNAAIYRAMVLACNSYPQPKQPLTDEQIDELWESIAPYYNTHDFARAIEAAHGIKGEA